MIRKTLLAGAAGLVFGGVLFHAGSARADLPVIAPATDSLLALLQTAVTDAISTMQKGITDALTDLTNPASVSSLLTAGFTQNANYSKAQIGAQQQIADASNTAMARYERDVRNSDIRDEQTANPENCATIDNGQVTEAAALQGWRAATAIEAVTDARGEALPNTPAYYGTGQAMEAAAQLHLQRYCSATDATAGLCTATQQADFDQRASSLLGADNLIDTDGVNAANDYGSNLIEPIVPAALRSDQLTSVNGQDAATRRRSYNARMSLARSIINYDIGVQSPGVTLTPAQQQQMTNEGIPVPKSSSWMQVISLEVNRRLADVSWAAGLQSMPPASVEREIATELALSNYLAFQNYRVGMMNATVSAARLAVATEHDFKPTTPMPSPSIAAN